MIYIFIVIIGARRRIEYGQRANPPGFHFGVHAPHVVRDFFRQSMPALRVWRPLSDVQKSSRNDGNGQPPSPMPCILLGQLATDTAWAGQGIGVGLLNHALARSVNGAALIGGRALMVNAIDDDAAAFWRRRGFMPSKDNALMLFRSIGDIAASLEAVREVVWRVANRASPHHHIRKSKTKGEKSAFDPFTKPKP